MEENNQVDEIKEPKKIEVVTGDGNLNISPVYEHIEVEKPRPKDTREVIIPEVKDNVTKKDDEEKKVVSSYLETTFFYFKILYIFLIFCFGFFTIIFLICYF